MLHSFIEFLCIHGDMTVNITSTNVIISLTLVSFTPTHDKAHQRMLVTYKGLDANVIAEILLMLALNTNKSIQMVCGFLLVLQFSSTNKFNLHIKQ